MVKRLVLTNDAGEVVNIAAFADDFTASTWGGYRVVQAQAAQNASIGDHWDGRKLTAKVTETPTKTRLDELREKAVDGTLTDAETLEATRLWLRGGN